MGAARDAGCEIRAVDAAELAQLSPALAEILRDCVLGGASVGFVAPFDLAMAEAYWRTEVASALLAGDRVVLIAERAGAVVGTAQIDCARQPNQPHRADVLKVLVAPAARRRGVARALMAAVERAAAARGRWLLTLDTASPDQAEPLYAALGYARAGAIPSYALAPLSPSYAPTVYMYKLLDSAPAAARG